MEEIYRIRIEKDALVFEVESQSKAFVESKYKEALETLLPSTTSAPSRQAIKKPGTQRIVKTDQKETKLDVPGYVNHIKKKAEFPTLETNALNAPDRLPRIMLCLYYAEEFFGSQYLTSGQISAVTPKFAFAIEGV